MGGIAVPLHLKANDYSPEACRQRYDLHTRMMQLNPKGWRVPAKHDRVLPKRNRLTRLAYLAHQGVA